MSETKQRKSIVYPDFSKLDKDDPLIQDKVFNVLYRHTGVIPNSIKTTDGLWKIMDSVDTMEFARDICEECKLDNFYFFYCVAFENIKPLTIDTIVKAVIETEKHSIKYKKEFNISDFTDVKPTENSHREIMEWAGERRLYCPGDLINVRGTKCIIPVRIVEKRSR